MALDPSKGIFLDVDPTIVENNLRFMPDSSEEFNKIFSAPGEQYPTKVVKPFPGFCIKSYLIGTDQKFFLNICQTDSIPSPDDISESDLNRILESDESSTYRVPMSVGEVRIERDRKQEEVKVCDVAINPKFYKKIQESSLFKNFLLTIVFEGIKNKHGIVCTDNKIILINKQAFGTLQVHRIQQREIEEKMKEQLKGERTVIEELKGEEKQKKPLIETISTNEIKTREPEYKLFRQKARPGVLIGEFKFPDVISSKEITLDVGEDRIVIDAASRHYLLDVFVPLIIRQVSCTSSFNKSTKILTVTMPLIGG